MKYIYPVIAYSQFIVHVVGDLEYVRDISDSGLANITEIRLQHSSPNQLTDWPTLILCWWIFWNMNIKKKISKQNYIFRKTMCWNYDITWFCPHYRVKQWGKHTAAGALRIKGRFGAVRDARDEHHSRQPVHFVATELIAKFLAQASFAFCAKCPTVNVPGWIVLDKAFVTITQKSKSKNSNLKKKTKKIGRRTLFFAILTLSHQPQSHLDALARKDPFSSHM